MKRSLETVEDRGTSKLSKEELLAVLAFCDGCLNCTSDEELHAAILKLTSFLGFEFVLYVYTGSAYNREQFVRFLNLSNPVEWMAEYDARSFVECDPVRVEFEHRLAVGAHFGSFAWDVYERPLSDRENEVIARRSAYGLKYGCSAFCNSQKQDSALLISMASAEQRVGENALIMAKHIVPHLNRCRKRLDLQLGIARLTAKERTVADWLVRGKSNWEIANLLDVTEHTVKFHMGRIYEKLQVGSRQAAVAVLLAERYL